MFRKLTVFAVFIVYVPIVLNLNALAQEEPAVVATKQPSMQIGFSFPTVGWVSLEEGYVKNITGFNFAVGYSWRTYPGGLKANQFNYYWGWGTLVLIVPYFELGTTYPFSLNSDGTNLFNVDFGVLYIIPYVGLSAIF